MKPLFLTDIDDTLITTARKITDFSLDECEPASTLEDGSISGYRTPKLKALQNMMAMGDVVPVTARSKTVLARCEIQQAPAIVSNGGSIILTDGKADPEWRKKILEKIGDGAEIDGVLQHVATTGGQDFRNWIVREDDLPIYVVAKSMSSDAKAVRELGEQIQLPDGWRLHINGNNLAATPSHISKRAAARYFLEKIRKETPNRLVIGMGDSLSDLGFMAECDFAMYPKSSQINAQLMESCKW